MNPLAHITLACGTVWVGARLLDRASGGRTVRATSVVKAGEAGKVRSADASAWSEASGIADRIDYRLVALGALLPDLIDRLIGRVLFSDALAANGHIYAHTLLFALALVVPGVYLLMRAGDPRLLSIGVAVVMHLATDPVTHAPENLVWPLLGWEFAHVKLLGPWATVATEAGAGLIMLLVGRRLFREGRLYPLIRDGRM